MTDPQDVPSPSPTVSEAMREAMDALGKLTRQCGQTLFIRVFLLPKVEAVEVAFGLIDSALAALERDNATLRAERDELSETFTDEDGFVWSPPTAWAYAAACKALNAKTAELATLRASAERMEAALKAAETRFSDIAAGNAFQPRLHAATGATEIRAALTPKETPDA